MKRAPKPNTMQKQPMNRELLRCIALFKETAIHFALQSMVCLTLISMTNTDIGAQEPRGGEIPGFTWTPVENRIQLRPTSKEGVSDAILPRMFNTVKELVLIDEEGTHPGTVQPEIETWKLSWPKAKGSWDRVVLELKLDGLPQWIPSVEKEGVDGSFRLPASHALTKGTKLRFEPQPFKNTVGYWVDESDYAWWTILIDRPGKFNVATLQGCGSGQGGSTVSLQAVPVDSQTSSKELTSEFVVEETGHFQNFIWRTVGTMTFSEKGTYRIELRCKSKAKGAVGDFREVQLLRLPDK